jgi:hypothetical protein
VSLTTDALEPAQISTSTIQEDHPLTSPRASQEPLLPPTNSISSPLPNANSPTLAYPGSPGDPGSRHVVSARGDVSGDPHVMRPKSPHDPWSVFGWAQPSADHSPDQLQGVCAADGDSLRPSHVASPSHGGPSTGGPGISPLKITGKRKRKGRKSFYCGRCNKDGVDHKYKDCPL